MMISPTGNNKLRRKSFTPPFPTGKRSVKTRAGFTLIEVMVAVMVLSFGLLLIYQAFFITLDAFNYCAHFLETAPNMDEKIWEAQDSVRRLGALVGGAPEGEFQKGSKVFHWTVANSVLDPASNLSQITVDLSWQEGKRDVHLQKTAYAIYETQ